MSVAEASGPKTSDLCDIAANVDTSLIRTHRCALEVAPSGVLVLSEVPFMEPRWWDTMPLRMFWSYWSWGSMIAEEYGWGWPRKIFKKHMTR